MKFLLVSLSMLCFTAAFANRPNTAPARNSASEATGPSGKTKRQANDECRREGKTGKELKACMQSKLNR